jgi:5-methylcytosine-specific restriction endonuclease McrA
MDTKHCNGCGQDKPRTEFYISEVSPLGKVKLQSRCKLCVRERVGRRKSGDRFGSRKERRRQREKAKRNRRLPNCKICGKPKKDREKGTCGSPDCVRLATEPAKRPWEKSISRALRKLKSKERDKWSQRISNAQSSLRQRSRIKRVPLSLIVNSSERCIELQQWQCALCGATLEPERSEIDHRLPRSKGGSEAADNLQWLCTTCNRAKGVMSNGEFIQLCLAVANRNSELRHQAGGPA